MNCDILRKTQFDGFLAHAAHVIRPKQELQSVKECFKATLGTKRECVAAGESRDVWRPLRVIV